MTAPDGTPDVQVRMHPLDGRIAQRFHFRKTTRAWPADEGGPRWLCLTVVDGLNPTLHVLTEDDVAGWLPMTPTQE